MSTKDQLVHIQNKYHVAQGSDLDLMALLLFFASFSSVSTLKSHSLRKSDTFQYGLQIEKIDFSETLPIFNLY